MLGLISTLRWTTVPMRINRRVRRLRSAAEMRDWARWIWRLRVSFLSPLGFQEFFFPLLEFLVQGLLAFQQLVKFLLWIHRFASDDGSIVR